MTGAPLVIDSSVAVKWLKPQGERHVAAAEALLDAHQAGDISLHAPSHLRLEIMNALWSHRTDARQITLALSVLRRLHITFVEPDEALLDHAAELSVQHGITAYDAVFAALARRLQCELVTDDRRLAESGACRARRLA